MDGASGVLSVFRVYDGVTTSAWYCCKICIVLTRTTLLFVVLFGQIGVDQLKTSVFSKMRHLRFDVK